MDNSKNFGINICGYINKQFGLGEGVRANIRSVEAAGIPHVLNDAKVALSQHVADGKIHDGLNEENPYPVNLVQINIDQLPNLIANTDRNYFIGKYNIAFWAWELEEFPEEAKPFFNLFNEIWVPSNFCAESISKNSPVPVLKFMHSIQIEQTPYTREDLGLPEGKFIFLGMFDYHSSIARKNPIGIIEAYERAFGINSQEVILVLKSSKSNEFPKDKERIVRRIGANKSIILMEEIMPREKLYSLINSCDCLVSLHRSEGFGLTMAEAMYLGKPVIATGYSANTEFMNLNNSFLVKYDLVDTGDAYTFVSGKGLWAGPNLQHAAELMKFVVENPHEASKIAERGRKDVHENLGPKKIGEKMKQRLELIQTDLLTKTSPSTSNREALLTLEKQLLQLKIDKLKGYAPIKLKLAIKNFSNRITGKSRKYMWED